MLILSRKHYEAIRIGDDIVITIVQIAGDRVRIGFDAPNSVPIHRGEIYQLRKSQQQQAESQEPSADE